MKLWFIALLGCLLLLSPSSQSIASSIKRMHQREPILQQVNHRASNLGSVFHSVYRKLDREVVARYFQLAQPAPYPKSGEAPAANGI